MQKIHKLLVANRGEISIRALRAASELGIRTVAVYTYEDRYSLHRYKADEAYQIGRDDEPLKPYLDIESIIRVAKTHGPRAEVMEALGDKVRAKEVAQQCQVPQIESSEADLVDFETAKTEANRIVY